MRSDLIAVQIKSSQSSLERPSTTQQLAVKRARVA